MLAALRPALEAALAAQGERLVQRDAASPGRPHAVCILCPDPLLQLSASGQQDVICAPLTALCPAPQTLLIITALVVAAAFTGLGIKWAEEWKSARISLQVSQLDVRDTPTVPLPDYHADPSAWLCAVGANPCFSLDCAALPGAVAVRSRMVVGLEGHPVLPSLALCLFQWL